MKSVQEKTDQAYRDFDYRRYFLPFMKANRLRSLWQLSNALFIFVLLWALMYFSLNVSYVLTIFLSIFAAGILIRFFVIMHDCGHGSYFSSSRVNTIVGSIIGVLLFIPFDYWKRDHLTHHGSLCNLDHYGKGDIWTLSKKDYDKLSSINKLIYRLYRNPFIMLVIAPFFLKNRIFSKKTSGSDKRAIITGNALFVLVIAVMCLLVGVKEFFLIQVPIIFFASIFGVWLFFVQHQFDGAVWCRSDTWNRKQAALKSTSYYKLPAALHWFSANIGYHNVHHLSPSIPNYFLPRCHQAGGLDSLVPVLTFRESLKLVRNQIWDEDLNRFTLI